MERPRVDALYGDAAFEQAIKDRIMARTTGRIQNLEVMVRDGQIVIRGSVGCYYLKQLAIHGLIEVVGRHGAAEVQSLIQVSKDPS
jgi:hypothetical protein